MCRVLQIGVLPAGEGRSWRRCACFPWSRQPTAATCWGLVATPPSRSL